ncbi:MAG TPA: hypothetical protein VGP33_05055, partial [Chloroflexota bacterium]|nr:hypothetical protein [Chloroflexota bacterium]
SLAGRRRPASGSFGSATAKATLPCKPVRADDADDLHSRRGAVGFLKGRLEAVPLAHGFQSPNQCVAA